MKRRVYPILVGLTLGAIGVGFLLRSELPQQQLWLSTALPNRPAEDTGRGSVLDYVVTRSKREPLASSENASQVQRKSKGLYGYVATAKLEAIAGALVELYRREGLDSSIPDEEYRRSAVLVSQTRTQADGRFQFAVPDGVAYEVRAKALGFCDSTSAPCYASKESVIVCYSGAQLFGSVHLENGRAAAATVNAYMVDRQELIATAVASSHSGYQFDCLQAGDYLIDVRSPEAPPETLRVRLEEGGSVEHTFVLKAASTLEVHVIDALTERCVPRARVFRDRIEFESDDQGVAIVQGCKPSSDVGLRIVSEKYARTEMLCFAGEAGSRQRVDVALERGVRIKGVVADAAGNRIPGAYVAAVGSTVGVPRRGQDDVRSTMSTTDGYFELNNVRRDRRQGLVISKEGYGELLIPCSFSMSDELDLGRIGLMPEVVLRGVVRGTEGASVSNCVVRVVLAESAEHPEWVISDSFSRETRTNEWGEFCIRGLAPANYGVTADCASCARRARVTCSVGFPESYVELILGGETISGSVIGPGRTPIGGCLVSVKANDGPSADYRSVRTDSDGTFVVSGVAVGATYALQTHYLSDSLAVHGRPLASITVSGVPAGARNVCIMVPYGRMVRVRLKGNGSVPFEQLTVRAIDKETKATLWASGVDRDGVCDIVVPESSACILRVHGKGGLIAEAIEVGAYEEVIEMQTSKAQ